MHKLIKTLQNFTETQQGAINDVERISKTIVNICNDFLKNPKVFQKSTVIHGEEVCNYNGQIQHFLI